MAARPALFRQEAIDFLHQRSSWGEVVSLQPISSTILSWSLAGLVALIFCFLSVAQYARKETVIGYLTPTFGTAKIFVPQQGFIKELQVKEGQEVAEGDPLLTIVTSQSPPTATTSISPCSQSWRSNAMWSSDRSLR